MSEARWLVIARHVPIVRCPARGARPLTRTHGLRSESALGRTSVTDSARRIKTIRWKHWRQALRRMQSRFAGATDDRISPVETLSEALECEPKVLR